MPFMYIAFIFILGFEGLTLAACGPKFFPKCGEPGVNCPPCSGLEQYPDPCAMKGDAGPDGAK